MQIIPGKEQEYAEYKAKNTDPYGGAVIDYTEAWADLMEAKLDDGKKLEGIAGETSHTADTNGITGFQYGCAAQALSYYWIHGEQLRHWHNLDTQIKDEGEKANEDGGILNPAILTIGK